MIWLCPSKAERHLVSLDASQSFCGVQSTAQPKPSRRPRTHNFAKCRVISQQQRQYDGAQRADGNVDENALIAVARMATLPIHPTSAPNSEAQNTLNAVTL